MKDISQKRKKIVDHLVKVFSIAEPKGLNAKRYKTLLESMTDKQFDDFMYELKNGNEVIYYRTENMTDNIIDPRKMLKAAEYLKVPLMQHLYMTDKATGLIIKTPEKYLVISVPIRRAQQYLDYKISTPDHDRKIDMLSGQVTGDSRSANITQPEAIILVQRGLPNTALELIKVRGGDMSAYNEFSRSCYETGMGSLQSLSTNSRARSAVVTQMYLKGMMLESNII